MDIQHKIPQNYNTKNGHITFRVATSKDVLEMCELGKRITGYEMRPEELLPYIDIPNSEVAHILIREGSIIAYFVFIPLTHNKLMQCMRREIYIAKVKPEKLIQLKPGEPFDCFIWEVMSDPKQRIISALLLRKMLAFLQTLGERGVEIDGIYATATSQEGISLCRKVGMHIMNLPEAIQPNYRPFALSIQDVKDSWAKNYLQLLEQYKRVHY